MKVKDFFDIPVGVRQAYMEVVFGDSPEAEKAKLMRREYGGNPLFIRFADAADRMKLAAKSGKRRAPGRKLEKV
jgi:hypothetical protein